MKMKRENNPKRPRQTAGKPALALISLFLLLAVFVSACGAAPTPVAQVQAAPLQNQPDVVTEIDVNQAAQRRQAGAFMLDVRQPEEWQAIHIPDATLIPLGELQQRLNELPKDQEIVVYCRSGNRSLTGAQILQQAGFSNVTSMAGGISEWQAAGYPTVSGE